MKFQAVASLVGPSRHVERLTLRTDLLFHLFAGIALGVDRSSQFRALTAAALQQFAQTARLGMRAVQLVEFVTHEVITLEHPAMHDERLQVGAVFGQALHERVVLGTFILIAVARVVEEVAPLVAADRKMAKLFVHIVELALKAVALIEFRPTDGKAALGRSDGLVSALLLFGSLADHLLLASDLRVELGGSRLVAFNLRGTGQDMLVKLVHGLHAVIAFEGSLIIAPGHVGFVSGSVLRFTSGLIGQRAVVGGKPSAVSRQPLDVRERIVKAGLRQPAAFDGLGVVGLVEQTASGHSAKPFAQAVADRGCGTGPIVNPAGDFAINLRTCQFFEQA